MERQAGRPFPPFPPSRSLCSGTCLYVLSRRERGTLTDSQCSQVSHLRRRAAALSGRPMYVLERERGVEGEREAFMSTSSSLPSAGCHFDRLGESVTHSLRQAPSSPPPYRIGAKGRGGAKRKKVVVNELGAVFYSIARRSAIIQVGCFVRTCSNEEEGDGSSFITPLTWPTPERRREGRQPACFVRLID